MDQATDTAQSFRAAYRGRFQGILSWQDLERLWERLRKSPAGWFVYAVGEPPPTETAPPAAFQRFLDEVGALLRREHGEDYCGIVYVDDPARPGFVKIFDPHNLGVVCGASDHPPPPGWIVSRLPPEDVSDRTPRPGIRRRWWYRLWGG